ncbi:hypothetical protein [Myceligenerans pegani]|uniref:Uncharacterized protein n=1 Tax=Myceligenerans pegani TaxID=2776917 RepID=A0ABR9N2L9_9MICO|nr:hypothetical protein [Myceligenerans sp. TRM 65318]MBE1877891.1 hypothetical protein [Myceligenerans sp. TRM 65318]MBE3020162.1 hypothetical protein [Myceligenerans sp. TRM 65318]
MRSLLRSAVVALSAGAVLLGGLVTPLAPTAEAATRKDSLRVETSAGPLDVTYSVSDVVTGTAPRVARVNFVFNPHGKSLRLSASGKSAIFVESRSDGYGERVYLVKDSGTRAHADFYLDASDPAGTYDIHLELAFTLDGEGNFGTYEESALSFSVKRQTKAAVTARRSGSSVVVSGSLRRAVPQYYNTEVGLKRYPDAKMALYFDPDGSAGPVYKATVTTSSKGTFSKKLAYPGAGRWIARFKGNWGYARSNVRPTGKLAPSADLTKTVKYTEPDNGITMSLKTAARNVTVVGSNDSRMRVDVTGAVSSGRLSLGVDYVCATSRIGRYDWYCSPAVKVSRTHYYANFWIGADDPASVYDLAVWGDFRLDKNSDGNYEDYIDFPADSGLASFTVTKRPNLRTTVSDTTARVGRTVKVSGTLKVPTQADKYNLRGYHPLSGQKLRIYFDPAGSAGPVLKAKVTTGSTGWYSKSFTARKSGTWIVKYAGHSSRYLGATSKKVWMSVR